MALIWSEKFETGIESIDRQHEKLFATVNELENLINTKTIDGPEIDKLISFLTEYVSMHFSHEEFCMDLARCPAAAQNKKAHEDFLRFFSAFKGDLAVSSPANRNALLIQLQQTLEKWLDGHICKIDVQLRKLRQPMVNQGAPNVSLN
jgi:hemerythrin